MLENPTIDINVCDRDSGVNSFWIAAFYGHGQIMALLAEQGVDIFNKNNKTGSNALHIAV